jgi:hypothetical protein
MHTQRHNIVRMRGNNLVPTGTGTMRRAVQQVTQCRDMPLFTR